MKNGLKVFVVLIIFFVEPLLAQDLEKLAHPPQGDEDEDIEVVLMTPDEFEEFIQNNVDLVDAKTVSCYYLARPFFTIDN